MKLRSYLFVFGVVSVVPVLLAVAGLVWWTGALQRDHAERGIHTAVRAVAVAVDSELRRAESVVLTLAAGFQAYLCKPAGPLELITTVRTLTGRDHAARREPIRMA